MMSPDPDEQSPQTLSTNNGQSVLGKKVKFKYQLEQQQRLASPTPELTPSPSQSKSQAAPQTPPAPQPNPLPPQNLQPVQSSRPAPTPQPTSPSRPSPQPKTKAKKGPKANPSNYQAAVPISVYRELAQEVHDLRSQMTQLRSQNAELSRQNQRMQQTLTNISAAVQTVGIVHPVETQRELPTSLQESSDYLDSVEAELEPSPFAPPVPEDWVMSREAPDQYPLLERFRNGELNNLLIWVIIVVLLVITMGGSFLLLKTLISDAPSD